MTVKDMSDSMEDEASARMIDDQCSIRMNKSSDENRSEVQSRSFHWNAHFYIEFSDLTYSVANGRGKKKETLHEVSGCFRPEKLTVIIGPSGAGKTTLLNVICGLKKSNLKGSITVNGEEIDRDSFRKEVCYIAQEFELLPLLTARETLYVAACLKLGRKTHNPQSVVNEIADGLGLTECLNTLAGNLSGGERKRLSIGVEIIMKPSILLLDEPTSGLDSAASNQVVNLLHTMARAGCTVVCAVHQPSSQMISQFDDMMVLSQGKCMYCGPRDEILSTFGSAGFVCPQFYNIAEFVLEVITEQRGGDLQSLQEIAYEKYKKWKLQNYHLGSGEHLLPMVASKEPFKNYQKDGAANDFEPLSCFQQQKILFLRAMICIKRDSTLTKLRFVAHVVVAILLGAVFYDFGEDAAKVYSNIACLFFILLFLFFANSMPAVQIFPTEAAVFLREHLNNWYHLSSYYIVKVMADCPMQIICATTFFTISYYMTGQPMDGTRVLKAWLISVLMTILGQSAGIATGAAFDTDLGVFIIPAASIPLLLFAGFFLKLKEISIYFQPLSIISFFRYAYEGMIQAIYDDDRPDLDCSEVYCLLQSPKKILTAVDMPSVAYHTTVTVLIAWIVSFHVVIYSVLWWRLRRATR